MDRYGRVDPDDVDSAITDKTILVAVMLANNEVGTIQPVAEIGRRVHAHRGVLFAVDAVQAAPYLDLDVSALDVDLARDERPQVRGAEGRRRALPPARHRTSSPSSRAAPRSGIAGAAPRTSPGAVGMAAAYELACRERAETVKRLRRLRERLQKAVLAVDGTELTGHPTERLPDHLSVIARDTDGDARDDVARSRRDRRVRRLGVHDAARPRSPTS